MATSPSLDSRGFNACLVAVLAALSPLAFVLPGWLLALLLGLTGLAWVQRSRGREFPAWVRVPVTLAATLLVIGAHGNIGRDTGAALLATMLVLKLLELRRVRDGRLVVSFGLFATMAAFLFQQGPLVFVLCLVSVLTAATVMARLTDASLPAPPPDGGRDRLLSGIRTSARLLALSIPFALVGFFLFPRLASPLWGLPGEATSARTGVGDSMSPGDMMELFADDSPILRVRFDGTQPDPASLYWRGPVLWDFDGRTWERGRWIEGRAPAALDENANLLSYELTQEPTDRRYVFALDVPHSVPPDLLLDPDRTLLAPQPLDRLSLHNLVSVTSYRLDPQLPPSLRERALRLPDGLNPRSIAMARQWRAEDPRPEALIRRAFDLYNREFTYTLRPPMLGRDSVDDFVFGTRAGYCEHFSSAFAVLMRAAGVPTRIVLGYHGGWYSANGNYWLVIKSDAHSWNEVWIPEQGWVRVDPTSAIAPERIITGSGRSVMQHGAMSDFLQQLALRSDWIKRGWNRLVLGFNAQSQKAMLAPLGIDTRDWRMIGAVFAAAAVLTVIGTLLLVMRQGMAASHPLPRAWRRLRRRAAKLGLEARPNEGPQAFARRAAGRFPKRASELDLLSQRYIAWRYAGQELSPNAQTELVRDLNRFRLRARDRGMGEPAA